MSGCQYFPKIEISAIVAIKVDSGWVSPMAGKPLGKTQIISTASTLQNQHRRSSPRSFRSCGRWKFPTVGMIEISWGNQKMFSECGHKTLGIQSYSQMMIRVSNHLLSKVFRFHYHSQKVTGSLGHKNFPEFGHECMACLMILDTSVSHEESWRRFRCASAGFAVNDFFEGLEKTIAPHFVNWTFLKSWIFRNVDNEYMLEIFKIICFRSFCQSTSFNWWTVLGYINPKPSEPAEHRCFLTLQESVP